MSEEHASSPAQAGSRKGRPRGIYVRAEELAVHLAREHLIEALHALSLADSAGLAAAMLRTGMAMLEIARADPDKKAHDMAVEFCRTAIESAEEGAEEKTT